MEIIQWYFVIFTLDADYIVNEDPIANIHAQVAAEILHVLSDKTYLKDAVLAFIDIFHRENGRSYDQDVKALKSIVDGAILPEDLEKGTTYVFLNITPWVSFSPIGND